jgi:hypothetical protein
MKTKFDNLLVRSSKMQSSPTLSEKEREKHKGKILAATCTMGLAQSTGLNPTLGSPYHGYCVCLCNHRGVMDWRG